LPNIKNVLPKLEEFIKMHPAIPDSIQNKALVRLQYLKYV
jgi:hypothetical protein